MTSDLPVIQILECKLTEAGPRFTDWAKKVTAGMLHSLLWQAANKYCTDKRTLRIVLNGYSSSQEKLLRKSTECSNI